LPLARVLRRRRSFAEFRDRGAQAIWVRLERAGIFPGARDLAAAEALPEISPLPFAPAPRAVLRAHFPESSAALVRRAERIVAGRYDLLGFVDVPLGDVPRWHRDAINGIEAPRRHWSAIPYLDAKTVGDHKIVWELNRHQHLVVLAQAYWLTGDVRFAQRIELHMVDWLRENPAKSGINWASSLEIAFRSIAWLWVSHLLGEDGGLRPETRAQMRACLLLQGAHVEQYLSTYFSPNTHLTGEALALVYLGGAFSGLPCGRRWMERGHQILRRELTRQIHPGGVYFEQSNSYQRYTCEFALHYLALAKAFELDVATEVSDRVRTCCRLLRWQMAADGTVPAIGDDDGGRLMPGARDPHAVAEVLQLSSWVLGDSQVQLGHGETAFQSAWLGGEAAIRWSTETATAPDGSALSCLGDGGMLIVRDGRAASADVWVLDAGPQGEGTGAHGHADALSVWLSSAGRQVLIDAGTFTYSGPARNGFRESLGHNTVVVDGASLAEPEYPFRWRTMAQSRLVHSIESNGCVSWCAWHDGYERLADPVRHQRAFLTVPGHFALLLDRIFARALHLMDARFLLAPALTLRLVDAQYGTIACGEGDPVIDIRVIGHGVTLESHEISVSPMYGARRTSVQLRAVPPVGCQEVLTLFTHAPATVTVDTAQPGHYLLSVRSAAADWRIKLRTTSAGDPSTMLPAAAVAPHWIIEKQQRPLSAWSEVFCSPEDR